MAERDYTQALDWRTPAKKSDGEPAEAEHAAAPEVSETVEQATAPFVNQDTLPPRADTAPAEKLKPKPVEAAPKIGTPTRLAYDAGDGDEDALSKLKQQIRPGQKKASIAPEKTVRVDLPESLVQMAVAQVPGARNRNLGLAAFLYLHLTADGHDVSVPQEVYDFAQGFHFDSGLDGVIEILAQMRSDMRLINKKLREQQFKDTELAQLLAWLILERKDMLESRNGPIENMDFQAPDITQVMRQTEADAADRIRKAERAEGVQLDKRRGSGGAER